MKDRFGREIDYLRISITDRCNLRCVYCMPENGIVQIPHKEILTYDEITRICRCMTELGIHKIKLTGGEPLTRKGCATLVAMLKSLNGIEKVTLTTNGILLGEQMAGLAEAGIDDINISLDTLSKTEFHRITRREGLSSVLESIEEALKYLRENDEATIKFYKGAPFLVEAPQFVDLVITDTEPGFAGNTAQGALKPATVETGLVIQVPLFIESGEKVQIDTRTGEYLGRSKE